MYKKGAGNDKQVKDKGNRTLCPYRNFSQAIMVSTISTEYKIKQVFKWSSSYRVWCSIFCQLKGNLACKLYSTSTVTCQRMEEIAGLVVEKIDVSAWKIPRSFIVWNLVPTINSSTFTGNWMYLHWFLYDVKCKYIDFRNIVNFQIPMLLLAVGHLEDKALEKGLVNVYIFQQPIALSKTWRFQNKSDRWKKKDCFEILTTTRY